MWITTIYPPFTPWRPITDALRGGISTAHCHISPTTGSLTFSGTLDSDTLGGAGFSSLITPTPLDMNLFDADGLFLNVARVEGGMMYTFIIKNEIPEDLDEGAYGEDGSVQRDGEGKKRERSTVSFEARFLPTKKGQMRIGWDCFRPHYRGKKMEGPDAPKLDLVNVRRMGLMVRSFFGKQDGSFVLEVAEIGTYAGDESQMFGGCNVV